MWCCYQRALLQNQHERVLYSIHYIVNFERIDLNLISAKQCRAGPGQAVKSFGPVQAVKYTKILGPGRIILARAHLYT